MSEPEHVDVLILGSGGGGKLTAWRMGKSGRRTAVVERRWIGGSCPNIACLPSKNEIRSAEVAHLARHAAEFGTITISVWSTMRLENYKASGAQLITGSGRFLAPKTLEVSARGAGTRTLTAGKIFLNIASHAARCSNGN